MTEVIKSAFCPECGASLKDKTIADTCNGCGVKLYSISVGSFNVVRKDNMIEGSLKAE